MAFMASTLMLVSCEDDPIVPPVATNVAPTIELQLATGDLVDSINITEQGMLSQEQEFVIVAADANSNLQTISYQRDGVDVALNSTDVRPDSSSNFVRANPAIILDSAGFTRTFFVVSPSTYSTSTTYTFTVRDLDGEEASAELTITQPEEIISTPLTQTLNGVLFNQAGPTGTGGLDLEGGLGTGSTSTLAEIRDMGIDSAIPLGTENWIQKIAPVNNTLLRKVSTTWVMENPFADVDSKEAVLEAFNSSSVDLSTSDRVLVGDVFAVYDARDGNYYLINTANVFVETEAAGATIRENGDRYSFDVKY
ncbi:MAG: hypothetical protein AB8F78_03095 [Saprospiraceae bacterium]